MLVVYAYVPIVTSGIWEVDSDSLVVIGDEAV